MSENDFEKQVKLLNEQWRLNPSEEVWTKVSRQIQREKRRRYLFVWIPLLLLMTGGGYWLRMDSAKVAVEKIRDLPGNQEVSPESIQLSSDKADDILEKKQMSIATETESANDEEKPGEISPQVKNRLSVQGINLETASVINERNENTLVTPAPTISDENEDIPVVAEKTIGKYRQISTELQTVSESGGLVPINERNMLEMKNPFSLTAGSNTSVHLIRKPVWEWGLTGSVGASYISDGFPGLNLDNQRDKSMADMAPNYPGGNFNAAPGGMVVVIPPTASPIRPGIAWNLGGFVKRKINSRFFVRGGLEYQYASANRMIGSRFSSYAGNLNSNLGSSFGRYTGYYAGHSINYTSRYHFISLPIDLEWRLNRSALLPVYLNGGLRFSGLVFSNALHFDSPTGLYFRDPSLFRRVQAGVSAGVSFELFAQRRHAVQIGPTLHYGLSDIIKHPGQENQHLFFMGFKTAWNLGKK
ncbi:MAG: outer membrane beta-barrel protein [Chitinophagaceae bacterium]|nr:outer membrane beta-barrel protein [Chitinophagaceae bacterium]